MRKSISKYNQEESPFISYNKYQRLKKQKKLKSNIYIR